VVDWSANGVKPPRELLTIATNRKTLLSRDDFLLTRSVPFPRGALWGRLPGGAGWLATGGHADSPMGSRRRRRHRVPSTNS
jgi:hypothetical protein